MSIIFDTDTNLSDMVHFDGTSTYTDRDKTTGDFFDDSDVVGAMLYFTWDRSVWHELTVNVGTALVADAITVVWEYYNGSIWTALSGVTDNTNAFQNAGVNTVDFTIPNDWVYSQNIGVSANDGMMIRARITALTNLTEGGANITNHITVKDYAISISSDETIEDVYNADVSGGWNVVNNVGNYHNVISNIIINAGGTLRVEYGMLEVGNTAVGPRMLMLPSATSKLYLGVSTSNDSNKGSMLYYHARNNLSPYNFWNGWLYMYNSIIIKTTGSFTDFAVNGNIWIENSVIETVSGVVYFTQNAQGTAKNLTIATPSSLLYMYSANIAFDNLSLKRSLGLLTYPNNTNINNSDFGTTKYYRNINLFTIYATDCVFDNYSTQLSITNATGTIKIRYNVSLDVFDENNNTITGHNVKITDAQGTVILDGSWTPQLLTTYTAYGNPRSDTDHNPFTIEISKAGYKTYKSKLNITNSNRYLTITLQKVKDINLSKRVIINN